MHERIKHRGGVWALLAVMVLAVMAFAFTFTSPKEASAAGTELVNLAQGKTATASSQEADSVKAANAVDGVTDSKDSRWGNNVGQRPAWMTVDLGKSYPVHSIEVYWERHNATNYEVQISNAETDPGENGEWMTVYSYEGDQPENLELHRTYELESVQQARFVRLLITDYLSNDPFSETDSEWDTVSIYELVVMGEGDGSEPVGPTQDPQENVALGKTAVADSSEASTLGADKAVDGDTTSKSSRWASAVDATASADGGPHWIYVDLGAEYDVKNIRIYWEMRKANGYHVDLATGDTAPGVDSSDWKTVYSNEGRPDSKTQTIELAQHL